MSAVHDFGDDLGARKKARWTKEGMNKARARMRALVKRLEDELRGAKAHKHTKHADAIQKILDVAKEELQRLRGYDEKHGGVTDGVDFGDVADADSTYGKLADEAAALGIDLSMPTGSGWKWGILGLLLGAVLGAASGSGKR